MNVIDNCEAFKHTVSGNFVKIIVSLSLFSFHLCCVHRYYYNYLFIFFNDLYCENRQNDLHVHLLFFRQL